MAEAGSGFIMQMRPSFGVEEADAVHAYMLSGGFVTEHRKSRELEAAVCALTGSKPVCVFR